MEDGDGERFRGQPEFRPMGDENVRGSRHGHPPALLETETAGSMMVGVP